MAHDSNTHDGAVTSLTVLQDKNKQDNTTHSPVVPSVSSQYVITDPTSYASVRKYSTQYPTDMSSTTVPNTYTINLNLSLLVHIWYSECILKDVLDLVVRMYA